MNTPFFKRTLLLLMITFCYLFVGNNLAYAKPVFPKQDAYITDAANILSSETETKLEQKLAAFDQEKGIQIALVTVNSLDGYPIRDYALQLGRNWGVGQEKVNSGIVYLAAINDREMTIEVGYGLEGALTDIESKWIINDVTPLFQTQSYDQAYTQIANDLTTAVAEENFAANRTSSNTTGPNDNIITFIIFFGIFGLSWLSSILGRSKSIWAGGIIGCLAGLAFGLFMAFGLLTIISTIITGLVGLAFDAIVSRNYQSAKSTPWWAGGNNHNWWDGPGGFGGGGSSSGGFGGFGGGSFGGGGSSGKW
jgi:uncharacterized protein